MSILLVVTRFTFVVLFLALPKIAVSANFGQDNRVPITPLVPEYDLAKSTAISVLSSMWSENVAGLIDIDSGQMRDLVCPDEKFYSHNTLEYSCSGFLVAPDVIATAGHCLVNTGVNPDNSNEFCKVYSWLFDYHDSSHSLAQTKQISSHRLYHCKKVIFAVKDEAEPFRDFALVQLDRPVTDRKPLEIAPNDDIYPYEILRMIGYPFGSSSKLSFGSKILVNDINKQIFVTNLDAFEGNSGSPVFNRKKQVVGITIGGTPSTSLIRKAGKDCFNYNRCDDSGNRCLVVGPNPLQFPGFQRIGTDVQRIRPVREKLQMYLKSITSL